MFRIRRDDKQRSPDLSAVIAHLEEVEQNLVFFDLWLGFNVSFAFLHFECEAMLSCACVFPEICAAVVA